MSVAVAMEIVFIPRVPGTPRGCCIRRDSDCDLVYRYDVTNVPSIGKAIGGYGWLCLFIISILHSHAGHSESLFVSTSSSRCQQILVIVSKF